MHVNWDADYTSTGGGSVVATPAPAIPRYTIVAGPDLATTPSLAIDWSANNYSQVGGGGPLAGPSRIPRWYVPVPSGSLKITGYAPTVPLAGLAGALHVQGYAPVVARHLGFGGLVTGGASVSLAVDWSGPDAILIGGSADALWPNPFELRLPLPTGAGALLIRGYAPALRVIAATGTLLIAGHAPTISSLFPTGRILVTGYAPGFSGPAAIRISTLGVDATIVALPETRVTSLGVEATLVPVPAVRLTSIGLEVISDGIILTAQAYVDGAVPQVINFTH